MYKDHVTEEQLNRWREFFTPSKNRPYYGIKSLNQLRSQPMMLRISASAYLEEALNGKQTVENVRTVIRTMLESYFCEDLYKELLESGFTDEYLWSDK